MLIGPIWGRIARHGERQVKWKKPTVSTWVYFFKSLGTAPLYIYTHGLKFDKKLLRDNQQGPASISRGDKTPEDFIGPVAVYTAIATLLSPDFDPRVCDSIGSPGDPPHMRIQWRQHVRSVDNELIFHAPEEINGVMTVSLREIPWHADPEIGSISAITLSSEVFEHTLSSPYQLCHWNVFYLQIYCYLIASSRLPLSLLCTSCFDFTDTCAPLGLSGSHCLRPILLASFLHVRYGKSRP
jgi:hypothetical protein